MPRVVRYIYLGGLGAFILIVLTEGGLSEYRKNFPVLPPTSRRLISFVSGPLRFHPACLRQHDTPAKAAVGDYSKRDALRKLALLSKLLKNNPTQFVSIRFPAMLRLLQVTIKIGILIFPRKSGRV